MKTRDAMIAMYDKYYSANIMKLVVCGEHSLDTLEKWVIESFSDVKDKQVEVLSYEQFGSPFQTPRNESLAVVKIVPIRDTRMLHMYWALPPLLGMHIQKPTEYIRYLLSHECKDSLLSKVSLIIS